MLVRFFRGLDYSVVLLSLALVAMGVTVIYGLSTDIAKYQDLWSRQALFALAGAVVMLVMSMADFRRIVAYGGVLYVLTLALLVLTAFHGTTRHGAQSWLYLPGVPVGLQTSEFAKLGVILMLVRVLARHEGKIASLVKCVLPGLLVAVPMALVLKQPDLGTALVFVPVLIGMLVLAGLAWPLVALLLSPALAGLAIAARALSPGWAYALIWLALTVGLFFWAWRAGAFRLEIVAVTACNVLLFCALTVYWPTFWGMLEPHQQSRLLVFADPDYDPTGAGWQVEQSKIAIGSGGWSGKGVGRGTQSHLNFLPETSTDFVFAVLAEEWGYLGGMALLVLFGLLLIRGLEIARSAGTPEGTLLAGGVVLLFLTHLFINVGMTTGLMPVTGLPLSFISYGGSALVTNLLAVGLLLSVYRYRGET